MLRRAEPEPWVGNPWVVPVLRITHRMRCFYAAGRGQPVPAHEIEEMAWLDIPQDTRAVSLPS